MDYYSDMLGDVDILGAGESPEILGSEKYKKDDFDEENGCQNVTDF